MNKFLLLAVTLLMMSQSVIADSNAYRIDVRVAAFFPGGRQIRTIYGDCLVDYEVEFGKNLRKNYELWGNLSWVEADGHTKALHTKTRFENANLSIGGKYIFHPEYKFQLYVGLGINGSYVHVHNDSTHIKRDVYKQGIGGVAKVGIYYKPSERFFCEVFSDYLYQTIHFRETVQIGGIKVGAGVGLCF